MSDLISRQDAIETICEEIMSRFDVGVTEGYELVEDALSGLPSAEPLLDWQKIVLTYLLPSVQPERKTGKWTATYSDCGGDVWVSWKCSNCGYVRKKGWKHTDDGKKPDALFCEMCNADMRGEKK